MRLKRGDIVLSVAKGDYGKPRPAIVVQANGINLLHDSVILALITSDLAHASHLRVAIEPTAQNGLDASSQIMVDKLASVPLSRIRRVLGKADRQTLLAIDQALLLLLGLGG